MRISRFFLFKEVRNILWCTAVFGAGLSMEAQTVIAGGGNAITTGSFYLGTHSPSPAGMVLTYDDALSNGVVVKFHANQLAAWLWENSTGTASPTTWPSMKLDLSNNLILYNGNNEGARLDPVHNKLILGGNGGAFLAASGSALSTSGAFTVAGAFTSTNGSFTGSSAAGLTLNSGGTAQNITLTTPTGTGDIIFNTNGIERARIKSSGNIGIGTSSPQSKLDVRGSIISANADFTNGVSGSFLQIQQGTTSGNTYSAIGAYSGGGGAWNNLVLQSGGGNVGIGTTTPTTTLQVVGPITAGTTASTLGTDYLYGNYYNGKLFVLGSQYSSAASFLGYAVKAQPGAFGYLSSTNILAPRSSVEANAGYVAFLTGASQTSTDGGAVTIAERMRIDQTGNVGIGSTTPNTRLSVAGLTDFGSASYSSTGSATTGIVLNANSGVVGAASTGIQFGGNGVAHANLSWKPNEKQFVFGTGNFPTDLTNPYGNVDLIVSGNVGIGTTSPAAKLNVVGSLRLDNPTSQTNFFATINPRYDASHPFGINVENNTGGIASEVIGVYSPAGGGSLNLGLGLNGNVGIGTTNPTQKLSVAGTIRAYAVVVDTGWSDYVFDDNYRLAPLSEVESHIKTEKHLPGIPSAMEVAEHGVSLGDMQSKLLAKVEELTLHLIAQEKRIERLEQENRDLRGQSAAP